MSPSLVSKVKHLPFLQLKEVLSASYFINQEVKEAQVKHKGAEVTGLRE